MARFTLDGRRVLTASWDGRARLFDLDGTLVATVGRPSPGISWAAISPTGDRIATAEMDGRAKLWDLSGRELKALRASGGRAWSVEFSPDGSLLLTGGEDGRAILHDLSGGPAVVLRADDLSCGAVFTSDGKHVVTKGTTGFVRVWTLAGDLEVSFRAHSRDVYGLDVDPSGRRIVTSAWEGVARQWLLRTEDVVRLADERRLREFTASESARFAELLEPPHGDAAR
jgi:WD40 repeat protein